MGIEEDDRRNRYMYGRPAGSVGQRRASFPMMQARQTKAATNPGPSRLAVCPCVCFIQMPGKGEQQSPPGGRS